MPYFKHLLKYHYLHSSCFGVSCYFFLSYFIHFWIDDFLSGMFWFSFFILCVSTAGFCFMITIRLVQSFFITILLFLMISFFNISHFFYCIVFMISLNCLCFLVAHQASLKQLFRILYQVYHLSPCVLND